MTQRISDYDCDLHMFREPPRAIDLGRLRFLRWFVEHERLGYPPAGPSSGEFADALITLTPVPETV
jgi:hypothetical protein